MELGQGEVREAGTNMVDGPPSGSTTDERDTLGLEEGEVDFFPGVLRIRMTELKDDGGREWFDSARSGDVERARGWAERLT